MNGSRGFEDMRPPICHTVCKGLISKGVHVFVNASGSSKEEIIVCADTCCYLEIWMYLLFFMPRIIQCRLHSFWTRYVEVVKYLHLFVITSGTACCLIFCMKIKVTVYFRSKMVSRRIKSIVVWGTWKKVWMRHKGSRTYGNNCFQWRTVTSV